MPVALVVHGGAWNIPDSSVEASREGVLTALTLGWRALSEGASAVDVVEMVVRALEDDSHFDAGRGSRLNREGKVELDASIMVGTRLEAGAVAAIQKVQHPISVARRVCGDGEHGAALLSEGSRVLTHCNAGALGTGGYGTGIGLIQSSWPAARLPLGATPARPAARSVRAWPSS